MEFIGSSRTAARAERVAAAGFDPFQVRQRATTPYTFRCKIAN